MYVCMYAMYVCNACMYVCMYVCVCVHVCMYLCSCVHLDVCTHVFIENRDGVHEEESSRPSPRQKGIDDRDRKPHDSMQGTYVYIYVLVYFCMYVPVYGQRCQIFSRASRGNVSYVCMYLCSSAYSCMYASMYVYSGEPWRTSRHMCQQKRVYVLEWRIHETSWMLNAAAVMMMFSGTHISVWMYQCMYAMKRAVTACTTHVPAGESLHTRMVHSRISVDDERGRGHRDVLCATLRLRLGPSGLRMRACFCSCARERERGRERERERQLHFAAAISVWG